MSARAFIDTNVFVYAFEGTSPNKQIRARNLIGELVAQGRGVISGQIVQEFVNVMIRRFPSAMSRADLRLYSERIFQPLIQAFSVLELLDNALDLRNRYQFPWYDSLIVAAALQARCEILFSEDFPDGLRIDTMIVRNPFAG